MFRRQFLSTGGLTLGAAALSLMSQAEERNRRGAGSTARGDGVTPEAEPSRNPLAARTPHAVPKAKRIIYLHMIGAASTLDLFDDKPVLRARDGEVCPDSLLEGKRFAFIGGQLKLAGSRFQFAKHGESGQTMSELLPHLSKMADDISVIRSLHTEEINHAPAQMFLHTGFGRGGRPSLGSWLSYGLGAETDDLPAYVVLLSGPTGGAGTSLWSTGFLPSVYQGIPFRSQGDPVLFLSSPEGHTVADRRRLLDAVRALNEQQFADVRDPEILTRISQYEMSIRMQQSVPELMDLTQETKSTLEMYGAQPGRPSFANNCLLARRLIERGTRVVQLFDSDWDHHADLATRLPSKARDVDRPMAALLRDLKQRGLLEETLVVWGSEFGRTPLYQGITATGASTKPGRDHHKDAYAMWVAGGGIKPGVSYGQTDDFGFNPADKPVHVHDLNATLLHLLGLDHERLTFKYQGREFRLTDVHGRVLRELLA